ncbi:MAG TPA: GH116 family glycosyl-hydrolase [Candidatus Hydrogenedentes bacterium]|nr:GH116 family glycosyl-hydrolase [Candidatus Hydrogenedentota bacterium]
MKKRYSRDELFNLGPQRVFSGASLSQIVFPIGGIGTGSVGLTGRGGLKDWEIFNRPNFGSVLPCTFPVVWAREKGREPVCRVLEGPVPPPHVGGGGGDPHASGEGFPHMDGCTFRGEYPFAHIEFNSRKLPVAISLEAYNPFIPSSADDSGFPAAIFHYTIRNTSRHPVDATVAWSLYNPIGSIGEAERDRVLGQVEFGLGQNVNLFVEKGPLRGLMFTSNKWRADHPRFGSMALMTPSKNITYTTHWLREGWFTPRHDFWDTFAPTGMLPSHEYGPSPEGQSDAGALGVRVRLKPGQSQVVTFYLSWFFPNFEAYWLGSGGSCACPSGGCGAAKPVWKNYYASQFDDALDVALKLHARERELHATTKRFHDALFSSTAPPYVLDAVSSQMAILKTATCLRLTDGTFYGFEGCAPVGGCCEGSCTHVWNYQQALAFLFPALERSMRTADYTYNMRDDGGMCFRLQLPIGAAPNTFHACADGQMGGIIKTYRDWMISGDDVWLKRLWPQVRRALEFAWVQWDADKDGVMDGIQHNTYDIEFVGPNPLTACFYLGALTAGAEMAEFFGETEKAAEYRAIAQRGRAWVEKNLFNGAYFEQRHNPEMAPQFQFGKGCLSDQVLGQWLTSLSGLGYAIDPKQIRKTLKSIFRFNWRSDMRAHANMQRVYAINDDAGLVLCTWPRGERPAVPFPYCDEVWTGFEYQVASHCIMEGLVEEGLTIVKAARDRHDGIKRNPWDEFECGHHYARAMSSYGLLLALSGFTFNKGNGTVGFEPRIRAERFRTFWALDGVWGTYEQTRKQAALRVLHGSIALSRIDLPAFAKPGPVLVEIGKRALRVEADAVGSVTFPRTIHLKTGQTLTIAR